MAVGLAGPKASQHRHQQVGLEQRQSGFSLSGGRAQSNESNCINGIDRWDERVVNILDRRERLRALQRGRFFLNTSRIASSSGL